VTTGWDRAAYGRYKQGDRDDAARAANRDYQRDYWRRRRAGETTTRGRRGDAVIVAPPTDRPRGAEGRDIATAYNMANVVALCRDTTGAARRFAKRGLGGVVGNRGQREVRALIAMEERLSRALASVQATRSVVAAERGEAGAE